MGRLNYQQRQAAREARAAKPTKPAKPGKPYAPSAAYQQMVGDYENNTIDTRNTYETNIAPVKEAYETNTQDIRDEYNTNTQGIRDDYNANLGLGRGTKTTTNANGVTQTMTNTGAITMPGLEEMERYVGGTIANFNGPSFPTQAETNKITDAYKFTASEFLTDPKNADGSAFEVPGVTGASTNIAVNGNTFRPQSYVPGGAGDIAGLDGFKPGGKFAGAPTATDGQAAEKPTRRRSYRADPSGEGIGGFDDEDMAITGPDPASYATSNQEARRRSAFLDASDSMQGLRDVERGMGIAYAGGNHYANVDGKMVQMDSDGDFSARNIKGQSESEAQALKDKWVKSLSAEQADEPQTASSAQNPTIPSGTSTFTEDNEIDLPGDAKGIDYSNNNQESTGITKPKVEFKPEKFNINSNLGGGYGATNFNL